MDQIAPAIALTTLGELMEILDIVSGKWQCCKGHHYQNVVI
jgi:hypothetical protein